MIKSRQLMVEFDLIDEIHATDGFEATVENILFY